MKRQTGAWLKSRNSRLWPVLFLSAMAMAGGNTYPDNVAAARADLAGRLGVSVEQVMVSRLREVTWPDSSLGCPVAGMRYMQVLVDGSQLILEVAGKPHYYHAGKTGEYFYCAKPAPETKKRAPPGALI